MVALGMGVKVADGTGLGGAKGGVIVGVGGRAVAVAGNDVTVALTGSIGWTLQAALNNSKNSTKKMRILSKRDFTLPQLEAQPDRNPKFPALLNLVGGG